MPKTTSESSPRTWSPASDYRAKTAHETAHDSRRADHTGAPEPFGEPCSGVVLVADPLATGARAAEALRLSLAAVGLEGAYVVWPTARLSVTLLSAEPSVLVAVGPDAARAVDDVGYPLVKASFSDAPEGAWFAWTKGASGLRLPALAPALADPEAKRHFWRTFLLLRDLAPEG